MNELNQSSRLRTQTIELGDSEKVCHTEPKESFWGRHKVAILFVGGLVGAVAAVALAAMFWPASFSVLGAWLISHNIVLVAVPEAAKIIVVAVAGIVSLATGVVAAFKACRSTTISEVPIDLKSLIDSKIYGERSEELPIGDMIGTRKDCDPKDFLIGDLPRGLSFSMTVDGTKKQYILPSLQTDANKAEEGLSIQIQDEIRKAREGAKSQISLIKDQQLEVFENTKKEILLQADQKISKIKATQLVSDFENDLTQAMVRFKNSQDIQKDVGNVMRFTSQLGSSPAYEVASARYSTQENYQNIMLTKPEKTEELEINIVGNTVIIKGRSKIPVFSMSDGMFDESKGQIGIVDQKYEYDITNEKFRTTFEFKEITTESCV